jgi:hypothetical protein
MASISVFNQPTRLSPMGRLWKLALGFQPINLASAINDTMFPQLREREYAMHQQSFSPNCYRQVKTPVEVPSASYVPDRFQLMIKRDRAIRNCRIVWISANSIGVAFE